MHRRKFSLVICMLLSVVCGCASQEGCQQKIIPASLKGVIRNQLLTARFDDQGNGLAAVLLQSKLVQFAEQLGLYNPPSAASRVSLLSEEAIVSMQIAVEVDLGVGNLSVELTKLTYDPANGTLLVDLLFRVRDAAGAETGRKSIQIIIGGITADSDGKIEAVSIEVIGYNADGTEVFRETLDDISLNAVVTNTAPQAVAKATPAGAKSFATVTLSAAGSADAEGAALTFHWAQTAGAPTVSLTGADTATATFTAPAVIQDTTYEFTLTVSDAALTATAVATVVVSPDASLTLLSLIPKDVNAAAAILNVKDLIDGVDSLTGMEESVLEMLPLPEGFDINTLDAGVAVLLRTSDEVVALLVEKSQADLLTLINTFAGGDNVTITTADAGDGVTKLSATSTYTYPWPPYTYTHTQDYFFAPASISAFTIVAPDKNSVLAVKNGTPSVVEHFDASWLAAFNARQLVVYSDGDIASLGGLAGGPPPVFTSLKTATSTAPEGLSILEDCNGICLVGVVGDPTALTLWVRFEDGSESLAKLNQMETLTASGLLGLPDEAILAASAAASNPLTLIDPVAFLDMAGLGDAIPQDFLDSLTKVMSMTRKSASSISELPAGQYGMLGVAQVVEVSDNDPATADDAQAYIAILQDVASDLNTQIQQAQLPPILVYRESTTYLPGQTVYQLGIDVQVLFSLAYLPTDQLLDITNGLDVALGDDGLFVNMVKVGTNRVVTSMGGGPARLQQIIDLVNAGSAPLASRPMIATAAAQLPAAPTQVTYVAFGQFAKIYYDFLDAADLGWLPEEDPGEAKSVVSTAVSRDGNSMRVDVVVPADSVQQIVDLMDILSGLSLNQLLFGVLGGVTM